MLATLWLELIAFCVFGALSFVFHDREGQPLIKRDFVADGIYFLLAVILYGQLSDLVFHWVRPSGLTALVQRLPMWAQILGVLLLYDFAQYWIHRLFHGGALWRFHAIHHSAEEIDVLTAYRWHPVNFVLYTTAPTAGLLLLGFSREAFAAVGLLNFVLSALSHANLDWTFGPLRRLIVSPMFHRWHHAVIEGAPERNFAPSFPVWDLLFGTFHMPPGERPERYGAPGVPRDVAGQLAFPFRA